jgi:hypothetical protein
MPAAGLAGSGQPTLSGTRLVTALQRGPSRAATATRAGSAAVGSAAGGPAGRRVHHPGSGTRQLRLLPAPRRPWRLLLPPCGSAAAAAAAGCPCCSLPRQARGCTAAAAAAAAAGCRARHGVPQTSHQAAARMSGCCAGTCDRPVPGTCLRGGRRCERPSAEAAGLHVVAAALGGLHGDSQHHHSSEGSPPQKRTQHARAPKYMPQRCAMACVCCRLDVSTVFRAQLMVLQQPPAPVLQVVRSGSA